MPAVSPNPTGQQHGGGKAQCTHLLRLCEGAVPAGGLPLLAQHCVRLQRHQGPQQQLRRDVLRLCKVRSPSYMVLQPPLPLPTWRIDGEQHFEIRAQCRCKQQVCRSAFALYRFNAVSKRRGRCMRGKACRYLHVPPPKMGGWPGAAMPLTPLPNGAPNMQVMPAAAQMQMSCYWSSLGLLQHEPQSPAQALCPENRIAFYASCSFLGLPNCDSRRRAAGLCCGRPWWLSAGAKHASNGRSRRGAEHTGSQVRCLPRVRTRPAWLGC